MNRRDAAALGGFKGLVVVATCGGLCMAFAAAALAGHSWYLKHPQIYTYGDYYTVGTKDPISQWNTFGVFDTAPECTKRLDKERSVADFALHSKDKAFANQMMRATMEAAANAECVASDDPRLMPTSTRWYAMSPPIDPRSHQPLAVPLSGWYFGKTYDAPSQCEMAKRIGLDAARSKGLSDDTLQGLENLECIATDDPRLKEK